MGCSPLPSFRPFELLEVDEFWSDSWPQKIGSFNVTVLPETVQRIPKIPMVSSLSCLMIRSGPFSSTAILVPAQRHFVRILKKLQATNDTNVFGKAFTRQVFGTKRHFQWWIMASSWHHRDITMTFSWHAPFHVKQIKHICENWCSVMAHLRVSRSMV